MSQSAPPPRPGDRPREQMPDELSPRHLVRRLLALGLLIGVVVAAVASLPGLGTLRGRFAQADGWFLALVGLLKLGSCLSNVVAFRDVFCPGMSWRFSAQLGLAEQGTNVLVPTGGAGGLALGAWALHQAGMASAHIARRSVAFFVLTSIPNFACAGIVGPLLLLGVFPGQAPFGPTLAFSVLAWTAAVAVCALPPVLRRVGSDSPRPGLVGRLRAGAVSLADGIRDTGRLLRPARWKAALGALGYLGFDIAALAAGFAAFGHSLPIGPLVFAYVIGQLGGLIPLPAGIGGTDGGLIGALVLYGSPLSQAAAADLAYRAFQLGIPAVLGTVAFARLRHTLRHAEGAIAECAPLGEEALAPAAAGGTI